MSRARLFVTCLADHVAPRTAEAVVTVLERLGVEIEVPRGQTCCGQPAFNGGFWDEARRMARHTLSVLDRRPDDPTPIVIPSGSCADMIVHHYAELFADDPPWRERAARVAEQVREFTSFIVDTVGVTNVGARFDGRLTYHSSCHLLRNLKVTAQPAALLAEVQGAEVVPLPAADECCGFGGLFSVKFPEISGDMLARKLENVLGTGADRVVGCDLSCLMQINAGLHRAGRAPCAVHIAEILAGTAGKSRAATQGGAGTAESD